MRPPHAPVLLARPSVPARFLVLSYGFLPLASLLAPQGPQIRLVSSGMVFCPIVVGFNAQPAQGTPPAHTNARTTPPRGCAIVCGPTSESARKTASIPKAVAGTPARAQKGSLVLDSTSRGEQA